MAITSTAISSLPARLVREVLKRGFLLVAALVPTRRSLVLVSGGGLEDQLLAVFEEAVAREPDLPVHWVVDDPEVAAQMLERVARTTVRPTFHQAWSPTAVVRLLTARLVVFTHGLPGALGPSRRRAVVNVWHGMPLKRIRGEDMIFGNDPIRAQLTCATSAFWCAKLAEEFRQPLSSIRAVGLPRNDRMLRPVDRAAQVRALGLDPDRPVVTMLPTYRSSPLYPGKWEGVETDTISQVPGLDVPELAALAGELDVQLVVKPHPATYWARTRSERHDDLLVVSNAGLADAGLTLADLLAVTDVLVTDYSSVWIDYVLLDRPMVFVLPDLEAYVGNRGFCVDNALDLLPGPRVETADELAAALRETVARLRGRDPDPYADARTESIELHHDVRDDRSAARLLDAIAPAVPDVLTARPPGTPSEVLR